MNYFLSTFAVPSFSKIACFETSSKLLPDVLGDFRDLVKDNKFQQAISTCAELAYDKSYKFFALGYHGICRSGPNARQQYHSKRSVSDKNCPNGIGIDKRIEVYTFGKFSLLNCCHSMVIENKLISKTISTTEQLLCWKCLNVIAYRRSGVGKGLFSKEFFFWVGL